MKKETGIAMINLIVTIIVVTILAGIVITGAISGQNSSKSNVKITELEMVQHAVVERYTKYKLTKNINLLKGTVVMPVALPQGEGSWQLTQQEIGDNLEKKYYKLEREDLEQLGLTAEEMDTYIVNYYTGEVFNFTKQRTNDGVLLYKSLD